MRGSMPGANQASLVRALAATFFVLAAVLATPAGDSVAAVSIEREFFQAVKPGPAAKRYAGHTLHRRSYLGPRKHHARRLSRWEFHKPARPVGPPPAGYVRSKSGATAEVNPKYQSQFQCLVNGLDAVGYPIRFMGGCRKTLIAGTTIRSKHWTCEALDVNQTGRNRVAVRLPANTTAIARSCGLFHGAQWRDADAGHFETLAGRKPWPQTIEPPHDLAKAAPGVKRAQIPLPRLRPVLAADFAELEIIPDSETLNLALLDLRAMPVALNVQPEPQPAPVPPHKNIFEAFADALMQPVGNCKGWDRIAPGVKRIAADATRHFSRLHGRPLIVEANSCYRDPKHNRKVGGARYSAHLNFTALDFQVTAPDHSWAVPAADLWAFCKSHKLARGCGVYRYKHIIHADVNPLRRPGLVTWDWRARRPTRLAQAKLKKNKKLAAKKIKKKKQWRRYAGR